VRCGSQKLLGRIDSLAVNVRPYTVAYNRLQLTTHRQRRPGPVITVGFLWPVRFKFPTRNSFRHDINVEIMWFRRRKIRGAISPNPLFTHGRRQWRGRIFTPFFPCACPFSAWYLKNRKKCSTSPGNPFILGWSAFERTLIYRIVSSKAHESQKHCRRGSLHSSECCWLLPGQSQKVVWSLTKLSTQCRSYRAFKVELYSKYQHLMSINSWGKITEKEKI